LEYEIWKPKVGGDKVFEDRVLSKAVGENEGVEMVCIGLKDSLMDVADEECGRTKEKHDIVKPGSG